MVKSIDNLEKQVDAFEQALSENPDTDLRDFLPRTDDPIYADTSLELMRIDLEHRWKVGSPRPLDNYLSSFSDVFEDSSRLSELAFEEYRCRAQAGEKVHPEEYTQRYSVPIDDWPLEDLTTTKPHPWQSFETIDDLGDESSRLVDAIQLFPEVGHKFLDFELIDRLGQGSFATVFLARQSQLADRQVVLKVSAVSSVEPDYLARLQHTNIVPIYSVHQRDNLQAVCMPYFGRTTLADVVRELKPLKQSPATGQFFIEQLRQEAPSDESRAAEPTKHSPLQMLQQSSYVDAVIQLAAELASGLEHAHQAGILHRDIKPANVLLTDDGRPMLLDFNMSDDIVVGGRTCLVVGGTWPYMSPEQRRSMDTGQPIDQRSDIYSLGVLIYQLLCRRLPTDPATTDGPNEINPWAEAADAPTISEIQMQNPAVTRGVASILQKCLEVDRDARYQTMLELKEDLQRHLEHRPLAHAADRSLVERAQKWARRHPRVVSASTIGCVAGVLLVAAMVSLAWRDRVVKRYQAESLVQELHQTLPELRIMFGARRVDDQLGIQAKEASRQILDRVDPQPEESWYEQGHVRRLSEEDRNQLRDETAELYSLMAASLVRSAAQATDDVEAAEAFERADAYLERAQQLYPDETPDTLADQRQSIESRRTPGEQAAVSQLVNATMQDEPTAMLAQQLMSQGRYLQAVPFLEALRTANPNDASTWFLLGNSYAALSRFSEAEGCFTTCATLWPESYLAWFNRGLCRLQMGQFAPAVEDFDRVLELRPDYPPALFNRALGRKAIKQYTGAIEDLTRVIALQGPRCRTLLVRARVYELMDDAEAAEADRLQALQTEPVDANGWMARALARVEDDPAAALQDVQRAQQIAPELRDVGRNLAYIHAEHLDQPEQAAQILADLVTRFGNPDDVMSQAVMLARMGRDADAIAMGNQALESRRDGKLVFQMACVYSLNADEHPEYVDLSVAHLAEAISMEPHLLGKLVKDTDLNNIRTTSEFRRVMQAAITLQRKVRDLKKSQP